MVHCTHSDTFLPRAGISSKLHPISDNCTYSGRSDPIAGDTVLADYRECDRNSSRLKPLVDPRIHWAHSIPKLEMGEEIDYLRVLEVVVATGRLQ